LVQVVREKPGMNRRFELTDQEWDRLAPLRP
jgi:hypothetical protein